MKSKQIILVVIGACLYALGINQLQVLSYGLGPFDTLTLQLTKITYINQFGNASFLIHLTFFIILCLLVKRYNLNYKLVGLSIISIFILTRIINLFSNLYYYPNKNIIVFIITFLILNLGLYFLAKSNLIIAPFDKFLVETSNFLQINFGIVRFAGDILILLIVIIINQIYNQIVPITFFTIIITVLTGLNITMYEMIITKFKKE